MSVPACHHRPAASRMRRSRGVSSSGGIGLRPVSQSARSLSGSSSICSSAPISDSSNAARCRARSHRSSGRSRTSRDAWLGTAVVGASHPARHVLVRSSARCHIAALRTACQPVDHDPLAPLFAPLTTLRGIGPTVAALIARVAGGERVIDLLFHCPSRTWTAAAPDHRAGTQPGKIATLAVEVVRHERPANPAPTLARGRDRRHRLRRTGVLPVHPRTADAAGREAAGLRQDRRVQRPANDAASRPPGAGRPDPNRMPAIEPVWPLTAGLWPRQVADRDGAGADAAARIARMARRGAAAAGEMAALRRGTARGAGPGRSARTKRNRSPPGLRRTAGRTGRARARPRPGARPARPQPDRRRRLAREGARPVRLHARPRRSSRRWPRSTPTWPPTAACCGCCKAMSAPARPLVALLAMLRAVEAGAQAALMAPTEVLAKQHHRTLSRLSPVPVALLTGSVKGRARGATAARPEGRLDPDCRRHACAVPGSRRVSRSGSGGDRRAAPLRRRISGCCSATRASRPTCW